MVIRPIAVPRMPTSVRPIFSVISMPRSEFGMYSSSANRTNYIILTSSGSGTYPELRIPYADQVNEVGEEIFLVEVVRVSGQGQMEKNKSPCCAATPTASPQSPLEAIPRRRRTDRAQLRLAEPKSLMSYTAGWASRLNWVS